MTQTYKVQVSMNQAHIVESGFVWKQGDFGFNIEIEVLDFDTTGATPQIIFRKSSGAVEATQISVAGNKFTYAIRGTELDIPGPCVCDLKLKDSTTKRVSTASFKYFVIPDTMDGLEQEASSYSDTIAQIIDGYEEQLDGFEEQLDGFEGQLDGFEGQLDDVKNAVSDGNLSANGDENTNIGGNVRWLQRFFTVPTNHDLLTDKKALANSTFDNSGNIISGSYLVFPQYIKVTPETTYIMNGASYYGSVRGYDANKEVVASGATVSSKKLTTAAGVYYVRISVAASATPDNVTFQVGETASTENLTLKNVVPADNSITNAKLIQGWHANNIFVALSSYDKVINTEVFSGYTLLYWEGSLLCRGKYSNGWSIADAITALGNEYSGTDSKGRTCVKIPQDNSFVIDLNDSSNRLKIVSRGNYSVDTQVLLACVLNIGVTQGMLVPLITASLEKKGYTIDAIIASLQAENPLNKTGIDRESTPAWALGALFSNGTVSESTKRIVTGYLEAFDGEKIIVEPKYNNGIYVFAVSFIKNSLGDYVKKDYFAESTLYANNTRTEIIVPEHCFIRICAYYRYEPTLTEDSMAALADMIYIQSSKTLLDFNQTIDKMYEYPYTPGTDFIKINRDLQNKNTISFVWASDTHHQQHNSSSVTSSGLSGLSKAKFEEMSSVADLVRADFLAITGDIVNGYYPVSEQKFNLLEVVDAVRKNTNIPAFLIEGNHDDNSWYASASGSAGTEPTGLAQVLQNDQFTSYAMNNSIEKVTLDADNTLAGYFYKDFKKSKIRVICLNSSDIPYIENQDLTLKYYGQWTFGFQERQIDWLANKALKFDEAGWGVVLMMHYDSNFTVNTQAQKNIDNVNDVLEAFIEKSSGTTTSSETDFEVSVNYDFTSNPSNEVLAWFSGHRHEDNSEVIDGIPHVMIINTFNETGGGYDIVTLDRSAKKIYTKRYNGEPMTTYDRTITW